MLSKLQNPKPISSGSKCSSPKHQIICPTLTCLKQSLSSKVKSTTSISERFNENTNLESESNCLINLIIGHVATSLCASPTPIGCLLTKLPDEKSESKNELTIESENVNCSVFNRVSPSRLPFKTFTTACMLDASLFGRVKVTFSGKRISSTFILSICSIHDQMSLSRVVKISYESKTFN